MNKKFRFFSRNNLFLNSLFVLLLFASCRLDIPIKEMSLAKSNLTRAVEVKSEKYAPEEYKKAKDELVGCHDFMKEEKLEEAKKAAENSIAFSDQAIVKSLPLLAEDYLNEADKIFSEAVHAFAEQYAPEEYTLAEDKILEADDLFRIDRYWESYLKSLEAISYATTARDKALLNIDALKQRLQNINNRLAELEALEGSGIAADELKEIDKYAAEASAYIEKNDLRAAYPNIAEAEAKLEVASLKIWQSLADGKIKLAEKALEEAEASPKKQAFESEIEEAGGLIDDGKRLFSEQAFPDSISKSEQAIEILNSVKVAMESMREEQKIEEETKIIESGISEVREYIVKYNPKARDCLWRIAHNVYKDARLWPLIYVANRDQIKDPDLIFPGQKFIIPDVPKRDDLTGTGEKEESPETESGIDKNAAIEPRSTGAENEMMEDNDAEKEMVTGDEFNDEDMEMEDESGDEIEGME